MDAKQFHIDPHASEPIYRQISDQIRRMASAGQLRPNDLLPSVREVASAHAINPMTVSRAYSQLETEGILIRHRGKGMAIAAIASTRESQSTRLRQIEPQLLEVVRHTHQLGLTAEHVLARLQQLLNKDLP